MLVNTTSVDNLSKVFIDVGSLMRRQFEVLLFIYVL